MALCIEREVALRCSQGHAWCCDKSRTLQCIRVAGNMRTELEPICRGAVTNQYCHVLWLCPRSGTAPVNRPIGLHSAGCKCGTLWVMCIRYIEQYPGILTLSSHLVRSNILDSYALGPLSELYCLSYV